MIFGLWIGSVVFTFAADFIQGGRIYKDACDNGYFINTTKLKEYIDKEDSEGKPFFINYLMPIYNFYYLYEHTLKYNELRDEISNLLSTIDVLEEMDFKEKAEYTEKPTIFNAIKMCIKNEIKDEINTNKSLENEFNCLINETKSNDNNIDFDKLILNDAEKRYNEGKLTSKELINLRNAILEVKNKNESETIHEEKPFTLRKRKK